MKEKSFQATNSGVKLVVGGRINKNNNNELQLDQNVYRHSAFLAQNWTKVLSIPGTFGTDYGITHSGFTVPNSVPSIYTDITNKG